MNITSFKTSEGQTKFDLEVDLIKQACKDEVFRQQLLSNPKSVLEKKYEVIIPAGIEIKVLEETPNTLYFVLPSKPAVSEIDELVEDHWNTVLGASTLRLDTYGCCGGGATLTTGDWCCN